MSKAAPAMEKVYDVFAAETRKLARLYEFEYHPKRASARSRKSRESVGTEPRTEPETVRS
jgi:predicted alpha/beta-hydrolase family hydrolase